MLNLKEFFESMHFGVSYISDYRQFIYNTKEKTRLCEFRIYFQGEWAVQIIIKNDRIFFTCVQFNLI